MKRRTRTLRKNKTYSLSGTLSEIIAHLGVGSVQVSLLERKLGCSDPLVLKIGADSGANNVRARPVDFRHTSSQRKSRRATHRTEAARRLPTSTCNTNIGCMGCALFVLSARERRTDRQKDSEIGGLAVLRATHEKEESRMDRSPSHIPFKTALHLCHQFRRGNKHTVAFLKQSPLCAFRSTSPPRM